MEELVTIFNRVLLFAGITIFDKSNQNSKKWLLFQYFNVFVGLMTFIFTTMFVLTNASNILLCIQGASIWVTGVIMFISLVICLVFRNQFGEFLEEMLFVDYIMEMPLVQHAFQIQAKPGRLLQLQELVISSRESLFKLTKLLMKSYVASVWFCATLYLCSPIYQMIVSEDKTLRLLAFDMWFPWGLENFTVYVASFLFHAYAGYLCCIAYPGLQSMIILLVGQVIRQLRVLTFILLHLDELVKELVQEKTDLWQPGCTLILSQCVDHYVKLKRFAKKLNKITQPFYLALILVSIMLVCVCSVKIAISDKILSLDVVKYCCHEFCWVLVVLMFCFLGQKVENECEKLEEAVTEKWYIFNTKHRVNVRIFKMAVSQRMPIYIFGSITLSLPTFTWFIKTGMSFFTFMMSVLNK